MELDDKDIKIIHLRDDLNQIQGRHTRSLQGWQHNLKTALDALSTGHPAVTKQRLQYVLSQINTVLEES